jgi:hypothetical protein
VSTTDAPPVTWSCWYRPGPRARWRKIGEAPDEAAAWRLAIQHAVSGDLTVCRPGKDPNAVTR